MNFDTDSRIWVCVEILKPNTSVTMRGSMLESDLNQIVAGTFQNKFVGIMDAHWTTTVKINNKNGIRFMTHGKDGEWKWHTGEYFIIVDRIIGIAILKDVSPFVHAELDMVYESNM